MIEKTITLSGLNFGDLKMLKDQLESEVARERIKANAKAAQRSIWEGPKASEREIELRRFIAVLERIL